jgi:hypothetical protein
MSPGRSGQICQQTKELRIERSLDHRRVSAQTGQQMRINIHKIDGSGNMQNSTLGVGQTQTIEVSDLLTILENSQ